MGGGMKNFIKATLFYNVYKKKFTKATLLNAEYMVQAGGDNWPDTDAELLRNAEEIIKKYSTAALIVTQRIHCALPCLGIGTPVIYTTGVNEPKFSTCRFGGILELFNVIRCNGTHLQPDFPTYGKISKENAPKNKNYWKPFATSLKERCINFLQD